MNFKRFKRKRYVIKWRNWGFFHFIFSVLFEEEERAQGDQKEALRRQIDALELEVLKNLRLQRDQMILENERMERLLQSLENPQNP